MSIFRPGKPRWKLLGDHGQVLPANTTTALAWDSTAWSEGSVTILGAAVEIEVAGLYLLHGALFAATTGANHNESVRIRVNGVAQCGNSHAATAAGFPTSCSTIEELEIGDLVDVVAVVGAVATSVDSSLTNFRGVRIGPVRWT